MLDELSVTNLGVIASARIEPGPGMTVVTGETGAGKTMLLGALRLLAGGSAKSDAIGPHGDEAIAEGRFVLDDQELVVGRRVTPQRSRAYLDGGMVAARALQDRLAAHVEIIGQHDQLELVRPGAVRRLVDRRLADRSIADAYREAWSRYSEMRLAQERLGGDRRALERERDLVAFQVEEIDIAGFSLGDDVALMSAAARLQHAERLAELARIAHQTLDEARGGVGAAVSAMRESAGLDPAQSDLLALVETIDAELGEAIGSARQASEDVDVDPQANEEVQKRLTLLGDLRRKYGDDLAEILEFRRQAGDRHDELAELLDRAAGIDADLSAASEELDKAGATLREARATAGDRVVEDALAHLLELGFSDPFLAIDVAQAAAGPDGADALEIRFASDRRLKPGPVARVASGGELSRLVLSLRLASGATDAAVVAFDEIDTGVGGTTALAMGAKLARLADDRQVLCVSHLPQVAAFADHHLVVDRDGASAAVRTVSGDARLEELSRMLSGLPDSQRGRRHAEELRDLAQEARS